MDCWSLSAVVIGNILLLAAGPLEVHLRDLFAELLLDVLPLELHGGCEEARLGGPQLAYQVHCLWYLKLLQPGKYFMK